MLARPRTARRHAGGRRRAPARRHAGARPGGGIFRFAVGDLEAIALKDGDIRVPNDGKTVGLGQPREAVRALLSAAGLSGDTIDFSIQPLLIRDGSRTMLFDAGAAAAPFAQAGRLPEALRAAGVAPAQVTDVFISHGHPDHVGGLVTAQARPAFPRARVHVAAPEWEAMRADPEQAALTSAIAPQVAPFAPDASLLPNVTAVAVRGHTPGHTAYRITARGESLLFIGDSAHHAVVSVERPEWTIAFDVGGDAAAAEESRRALLERAADEGWRLYAGHFPFPGVGRVQRRAGGLVWRPEAAGGAR